MDRFGMKPALTLGPLLVAAALIMVVRATVFPALLPAVFLLGIGGGALNGATNTLVADLHDDPKSKSAALNLLGVFFGFGALFLPFTMGALLAQFSVGQLMTAAAVLCGAVGILTAVLRFPPPKQVNARSRDAAFSALSAGAGVRRPAFLPIGRRVHPGRLHLHVPHARDAGSFVSTASWILAGYWASLMVARAVLSRRALKADPYRILLFCSLAACAGSLLAAAAPNARSRQRR